MAQIFTQVLDEGALPMKKFWWTDGKILKGGAKKMCIEPPKGEILGRERENIKKRDVTIRDN